MSIIQIQREEAYNLVVEKIGMNNLLKHIIAVEAGMRQLAKHFGEDEDFWGMTGLLHDLDYNETKDDELRHTYITAEWLTKYSLPKEMIHAIHAHPGHIPCQSKLDWALYAVDPTTGFLVACALMHPDKKLASLDSKFLLKRFKEKRFAAGATRENIAACSNLSLELDQFMLMVRDGMLTISDKLGM